MIDRYLDYAGRADRLSGGARRIPVHTPSGTFSVWTKRTGNSPDLKVLSHMYRHAWHAGLKTTYYLRTLGASNIEKATVTVKKEVRGAAGETKGETATRDAKDVATAAALTTAPFGATDASPKKTYTQAEKNTCSIEAMKNGEICEACQ